MDGGKNILNWCCNNIPEVISLIISLISIIIAIRSQWINNKRYKNETKNSVYSNLYAEIYHLKNEEKSANYSIVISNHGLFTLYNVSVYIKRPQKNYKYTDCPFKSNYYISLNKGETKEIKIIYPSNELVGIQFDINYSYNFDNSEYNDSKSFDLKTKFKK